MSTNHSKPMRRKKEAKHSVTAVSPRCALGRLHGVWCHESGSEASQRREDTQKMLLSVVSAASVLGQGADVVSTRGDSVFSPPMGSECDMEAAMDKIARKRKQEN